MKRLLCAVLAALLLLPGCGAPAYDPAKPHAPAGPTVVPAGDPAAPQYVALTFDDGPSPRCTPRLLDGLRPAARGPPSSWWAARP